MVVHCNHILLGETGELNTREEEAATASQEEPTCDGSVNEIMLTSVSVLCRFTQLLTLYLYPAKEHGTIEQVVDPFVADPPR